VIQRAIGADEVIQFVKERSACVPYKRVLGLIFGAGCYFFEFLQHEMIRGDIPIALGEV
jgi:hypothetical protein